MNAQNILAEMARRYFSINSYQDRGIVLVQFPDGELPREVYFSTFFRRPDRFRFEWTKHHPYPPLRHIKTHRVIRTSGNGVFLHSDQGQTNELQESLSIAIGRSTGASSGSSLTVSNLLLPEIGGFKLDQLQQTFLSEDVYEGVECHRIDGRHPLGTSYTIYLGAHDFLLRCVRECNSGGVISDEIRRNVRVNASIEDETFL